MEHLYNKRSIAFTKASGYSSCNPSEPEITFASTPGILAKASISAFDLGGDCWPITTVMGTVKQLNLDKNSSLFLKVSKAPVTKAAEPNLAPGC